MYCLYATFIDLSKAFDTMDYAILFHKLEQLGIRGLVLKLIKSYFSDRVQVVKINNILSNKKVVKIGVPQGSILGPLLFIIYVNDNITSVTGRISVTLIKFKLKLIFKFKYS